MKLAFKLGCMLLAAAIAAGCGGGDDSTSDPSNTMRDDYDAKVAEAGGNVRKLMEVNDWVEATIAAGGARSEALVPLRGEIKNKVATTFRKIAEAQSNQGSADTIDQLVEWADSIIAREEAKPEAERDEVARRLVTPRDELLQALLANAPQRDDVRKRLGWFEVDPIEEYADADWMEYDDVIADIQKLSARIKRDAFKGKDEKRWLPSRWSHKKDYDDLLKRLDEIETAHEEKMEDPFVKAAYRVFAQVKKDLESGLNTAYRWVPRVHKPYLIIVEQDKSWNEDDVAKEKATALLELMRTYYAEYGDKLKLKKIDQPVPVILFRKQDAYYEYVKATSKMTPGLQAHYEPWSGRLFVSDTIKNSVLMHEGTHQIVHFNQKWIPPLERSYWFSEGVAEYFAGSFRYLDKETGAWRYDIGRLQMDRLNYWRQNEHKAMDLWDVIDMRKRDEQRNKKDDDVDMNLFVYSQGWFIIYFLNTYNVDADGLVQIGKPGKYKENWTRYLGAELGGDTGRNVFLKCMDLVNDKGEPVDEAHPKWRAFKKEILDYYEWMNRKTAKRYHVKDNQLVPWQEVKNRKGIKIGEREDDLLILPKGDDDG